ncbi:MAG: RES family NAD+ phosphorylase [Pseudomonadota bacterium]
MRPYEPYRGNVWRVIEQQYRPATRKLVDTNAEQSRLEDLIEANKPPMPTECQHLDYQFAAPFRYGPYPGSSRFRRTGRTKGVYYASETSRTAAVETAWNKVKFFRQSKGTPYPANPTDHTAVQAAIAVPLSINLMHPAMADPAWEHPSDYAPCCALADEVRAEGCEVIRYRAVRDPAAEANLAVLTCRAFEQPRPIGTETWQILLQGGLVVLTNETLRQQYEYAIGTQALET